MTIQDLYTAYLAGKPLGTITSRAARQLLDLARNAILTKGKEPKFSTAPGTAESEKQSLLAAGDQLRQLGIADQGAIYASAVKDSLGGRTLEECEQLLADFLATNAKYPTRPKPTPKPAAKSDQFTAVQEQFAKARQLTAAENARRTPAPRPTPAKSRTPLHDTYVSLKRTNPRAAADFWAKHKDGIHAEI
jgi:hypothetical protein